MDSVAGRDQVKTAIGIELTGRLCVKLQARTNAFCRRGRTRPRNRVLVWIDADDLAAGERLSDCDADPANSTADVERATTLLEAIDHVGKHVKPLAYEAVLILTAIEPIECIDPIGADFVECDASA